MAGGTRTWPVERIPRPDDHDAYLAGVEAVTGGDREGKPAAGSPVPQGGAAHRDACHRGLPFPAQPQSLAVHVLPGFRGVPALRRLTRGAREGQGRAGHDPSACRHAPPRGDHARGPGTGKELLADQKERAEHLMLVDLARNDLGRVCVPGSVEVPEFMDVERYSHVMHIVSQVEGQARGGQERPGCPARHLPRGHGLGAPKIRAIEVIDSLEPDPRGFYAGVIAHVESDGSLDSCITIRSALKKGRPHDPAGRRGDRLRFGAAEGVRRNRSQAGRPGPRAGHRRRT